MPPSPSGRPIRRIALAVALAALFLSAGVPAQDDGGDDAREFVVLRAGGRLHQVRSVRERGRIYLSLADLAAAVGGVWGRDPLSRDPLLTVGGDRVLFAADDRRVAVNGRRRRLSRPPVFRADGVYVPGDFIERVLDDLIPGEVVLVGAPRALPEGAGTEAELDRSGRISGEPGDATGLDPGLDDRRLDRRRLDEPWRRRSGFFGSRRRAAGGVETIVLDPGHGGEEEGARGPTGLLEKDVVLDVATRLETLLEDDGFRVVLTRSRDRGVTLEERTAIANHEKADIFISLHANASPSSEAGGAETYYLSLARAGEAARQDAASRDPGALLATGDRNDPLQAILWDMAQSTWLAESSALAEIIQADFNDLLGIPDRGVKQAPLRVLVGATMPAVLVEIGFISNPDEELKLQDPDFLVAIVTSLRRSIWNHDDRVRRRAGGWDTGSGRGAP